MIGETDSQDSDSDGDAPSDEDAPRDAPRDALRGYLRHLDFELDSASLSPAFGSEEAALTALRNVGEILHRVAIHESEQLSYVRSHMAQFLAMLDAQPSQENGNHLRDFIGVLERTLNSREHWPSDPIEDPRIGTVLEGVDQMVFEHQSEGLIELGWKNPLPKPEWLGLGGFQCDVCSKQDLLLSYQHVTEDNTRDNSTFIVSRVGYDVCGTCAVDHVEQHRQLVCSWIASAVPGVPRTFQRPKVATTCRDAEIQLTARPVPLSHGGYSLEVGVLGTAGLHVEVALLPSPTGDSPVIVSGGSAAQRAQLHLPQSWFSTSTSLSSSPQEQHVVPIPVSDEQVEFTCAAGDRLRLSSQERGVLLCFWAALPGSQRPSCEFVPCKALCLSERVVEEADGVSSVYRSGDRAPYLAFQKLGRGVFLPPSDAPRVLAELHALASKSGAAHNIPRQAPAPPCPTPGWSSASSSHAHGAGTAGGLLVSSNWAELGDCVICMDTLAGATGFRGLPLRTGCGHNFHAMCLRKHLRGHHDLRGPVCPNCRAQNPLAESRHLTGDGSLTFLFERNVLNQALDPNRSYRVVGILCQDPQAVVDSTRALTCEVIRLGDQTEP